MVIKRQKTLKSIHFIIFIFLAAICIPNLSISAGNETGTSSGVIIDKLADDISGEISIQDSNGTVSLEQARTWIAQHPEIRRIITFERFRFGGLNYNSINTLLPKDKLPVLYRLLDDEQYAPYWPNISTVIGYVSDDPNTVSVLLNYFKRDDGEKLSWMTGKIWTLAYIGKIGGDAADSILRKAITKEGARELAKDWLDEQLWQEKRPYNNTDKVILEIRNAASKGLIYTCKPENWKIVEDLYNQHKETSIKNGRKTDIVSHLMDAMGIRDFLVDNNNDIKAFYRLSPERQISVISSYYKKYRFMDYTGRVIQQEN
ncbi:MAG: hypothetical protein JW787_15005 [Sedimentisphaerales bacterium]|nr:hypothetical protein [Sedimentisphaerales bacterium]